MFDIDMEDAKDTCVLIRMIGITFILMRKEHNVGAGMGVNSILFTSHVIHCVVYPHCLALVKSIIYNFYCVVLIISISLIDAI